MEERENQGENHNIIIISRKSKCCKFIKEEHCNLHNLIFLMQPGRFGNNIKSNLRVCKATDSAKDFTRWEEFSFVFHLLESFIRNWNVHIWMTAFYCCRRGVYSAGRKVINIPKFYDFRSSLIFITSWNSSCVKECCHYYYPKWTLFLNFSFKSRARVWQWLLGGPTISRIGGMGRLRQKLSKRLLEDRQVLPSRIAE